jgi:DNA polymerase-4
MPIWQARQLCPDIIIVSTNHANYAKYSKIVEQVYYRYTDMVEAFGGDECWLDVTGSGVIARNIVTKQSPVPCDSRNDMGKLVADEIRRVIREEVGLTCSVGVSWNKTYSKIGSDLKKPDATTVITRENYRDVIYPLGVGDMLYIGKKTARTLERLNIRTIGELAGADPEYLCGHLGINAYKMVQMARGDDDDAVRTYDKKRTVKSVGNGTTTPHDLTTMQEIEQVLYMLAEEVGTRMRRKGVKGTTIHLSVRDKDLQWSGAQETVGRATNSASTISSGAMKIFTRLGSPLPVRSLRIAVSNFANDTNTQMSFFNERDEDKNDKVSKVFDAIRRKYGTQSVMFGTGMGEFKLEFEVLDE